MVKMQFDSDFTFVPDENRMFSIAYKAGKTYPNVRRACVVKALAAGAGRVIAEDNDTSTDKEEERPDNDLSECEDAGAGSPPEASGENTSQHETEDGTSAR